MPSDARRPSVPAKSGDLQLLRQFEPVARFTKGEEFLPANAADYVRECSLWVHQDNGEEVLLIKQGDLSIETLTELPPARFGAVHYLRFIETLSITEAAAVLAERGRVRANSAERFHVGVGRLARGGFLPRIADALFSLTLLLRGRVPAATAAAAVLAYLGMRREPATTSRGGALGRPRPVYYGRVLRADGWVVLQYWYFYAYNNWRSGFQGVNDHEGDWENINVYLYEVREVLYPEWANYASHDFSGDDMRRHWDDRGELSIVDGHPVVFVGAGSHACYFRPGEYQAEVTLPAPDWLRLVVRSWRRFWTEILGQQVGDPFRIPFVDYARGDGHCIGYGGEADWEPVLIDQSTPWIAHYRGLWGLFARDPISGENAPAGPMYNRDGTPRLAWYDPLGYAGLDKVAPPPRAAQMLQKECDRIDARAIELHRLIGQKSAELQALGVRLKGMEGRPHLAKQYLALVAQLADLGRAVRSLRREISDGAILLEGLQNRLADLKRGRPEDPRSHIRRLAAPVTLSKARYERAVETWASMSLGMLLVGAAALLLVSPHFFWAGILVLIGMFLLIEAALRGAFSQMLARIATVLALTVVILVLLHYWREVLSLGLLVVAFYLLTQRLREAA